MLFFDGLDGGLLRDRCLPWLSAAELARYEAFSTDELRRQYLAGVALCRRSLSQHAPVDPSAWRFAQNAHGKPRIAAPAQHRSLKFSLARTKGLAVCLVTRAGAVGVDVENTTRAIDAEAVARHFLSAAEGRRLATLSPVAQSQMLFKRWVVHEAHVKGVGKGLAASPERGRVRFGPDDAPLPMGSWRLFYYEPSATHVAAAAIRRAHDGSESSITWLRASLL